MSPRAQLLVAVLAVGGIVFVFRMVRRRQIKVKYLLLWLIVALVAAMLAAFPDVFDQLSQLAGIAYPPTLLFLLAISFLFFVVIQFSWELSRLEDRSRRLAEELALLRLAVESLDRKRETEPVESTLGAAPAEVEGRVIDGGSR